jgi:hypothetical protein
MPNFPDASQAQSAICSSSATRNRNAPYDLHSWKNRTAICGFLVAPRPAGVMAALLLAFPCLTMQIDAAKAQTYVAGTITFSNMMPTGVFLYKCTGSGAGPSPLCDSQQQLGISGYITPVPLQRNPVGDPLDPAPQAFLYATGSYVLWQRGQKTGSWNGHTARISPSASRRTGRTSFPMPILGRIRTSGEPSPAMAMRRITRLKFPTPSRRRLNVTLPPPADVQGRRFAPEGAGQAALELAGLGLPFAARDAAPLAPPAAADG